MGSRYSKAPGFSVALATEPPHVVNLRLSFLHTDERTLYLFQFFSASECVISKAAGPAITLGR